ncbi:MAG: hypothetical protein Fur003_4530 [Candidatus Dojkabacteria bacterium]
MKKSSKAKPEVKEEQLGLGLVEPGSNKVHKLRRKLKDRFLYFETRRFIKSPYSWVSVMLSLALLATQLYYILNFINKLPSIIPIYSNSIDLAARLAPQSALYIFPALSLIIIIVTVVSGYRLYNTRRELINFSLINMTANVGILTFIFMRIISTYI